MNRIGHVRRLLRLGVLLLLAGCIRGESSATSEPATGLSPGPLLEPASIGEPFFWLQRVTATWADRSESFDAVLQLHDDELMLLGLGPMGRPGFIVTLSADGVAFENRSGRRVPFDPEHIIADVQKVFYPWMPEPPAEFSGTRALVHGILTITETHVDGRLRGRTFERSDARERGALRVIYGDWDPSARAPSRAVLDNPWFGYELTIVTVEQRSLPIEAAGSAAAAR